MEVYVPILLLIVAALVASIVSAITGFGGALIMLPFLIPVLGTRDAIPVLTIAQIVGNAARAIFNRSDINYPVVKWFSLGSIPAGILGGVLFASAPLAYLHKAIGVLLIGTVVAGRLVSKKVSHEQSQRFKVTWFAPLGALCNFLSAIMGSVGPIMAPFFLAFGLRKAAYVGTEALAALIMHVAKTATYTSSDLLSLRLLAIGLLIGLILIGGSYIGKQFVGKLSEQSFALVIEVMLVVVGIYFVAF